VRHRRSDLADRHEPAGSDQLAVQFLGLAAEFFFAQRDHLVDLAAQRIHFPFTAVVSNELAGDGKTVAPARFDGFPAGSPFESRCAP